MQARRKPVAKTFETWLPIFPGFYGTVFEMDDYDAKRSIADNIAYYVYGKDGDNDRISELSEALVRDADLYRCTDTDYGSYCAEVCRQATVTISDDLKNIPGGVTLEFEKVVSPREYNFTNDSANVRMKVADVRKFQAWLLATLFRGDEASGFALWIRKRYTGCDGYIPYYSSDVDDWKACVRDADFDGHYGGVFLEYILRNRLAGTSIDDSESLSYGVDVYASEYTRLKEEKTLAKRLGKLREWFERGDWQADEYSNECAKQEAVAYNLKEWMRTKVEAVVEECTREL